MVDRRRRKQSLVKVGDKVQVVLPDGTTMPATIATDRNRRDRTEPERARRADDHRRRSTLDDPNGAPNLDQAPVKVRRHDQRRSRRAGGAGQRAARAQRRWVRGRAVECATARPSWSPWSSARSPTTSFKVDAATMQGRATKWWSRDDHERRSLRQLERRGEGVPRPPPVRALDAVDLRIDRGEMVAIVGPSGSGKSTLLNIIGALDLPTTGEVRIDGHDVAELGDRQLSALRAKAIGFVFQQFHLLDALTRARQCRDGSALPRRPGARAPRERAASALDRVGLAHRLDHRPTSSRAANASVWRSPARWSATRRSCSPTNRPATSTPAPAARSSTCSARSTPTGTTDRGHHPRPEHRGDRSPAASRCATGAS